MDKNKCSLILICVFLLSGCALFKPVQTEDLPELDYPGPDSEIQAILDQYRGKYKDMVGKKIATVHDTLRFSKPESALNNYVADALRFRAANELQRFVHVGIIGMSSFKLYFEPGDLQIKDILEFMPYDNHLVVLTMNGAQLTELVNQVAQQGGAPISGIRFRIDENNRARGILVNSEIIDPNRKYLIATGSWSANGGDNFPALWNPQNRVDLNVDLKELYVEFFTIQSDLYNITDNRIRL